MTSWNWATVTALSPLRIRLDGDPSAIPVTPDSLVDPRTLVVGDRVRVELTDANGLVVQGKAGGNSATLPFQVTWSAGSLAAGAETEIEIPLPSSCVITRMSTSGAARVRIYPSAAASTADASRASGVMPAENQSPIVELDGGSAAEDVVLAPLGIAANGDGTSLFKTRVKNRGGSTATITGSVWVAL